MHSNPLILLALPFLSISCLRDSSQPEQTPQEVKREDIIHVEPRTEDFPVQTNNISLTGLPSEVIYGLHSQIRLIASCTEPEWEGLIACSLFDGESVEVIDVTQNGVITLDVTGPGESVIEVAFGRYFKYFLVSVKNPVVCLVDVSTQFEQDGLVSASGVHVATPGEPFDIRYKVCASPLGGKNRFQTITAEGELSVAKEYENLIDLSPILNGYTYDDMTAGGLCVRLYICPSDQMNSPQVIPLSHDTVPLDFLWARTISVISEDKEPINDFSPDISLDGLQDKVKTNTIQHVSMSYHSWRQAELSIHSDDNAVSISPTGNTATLYFLSGGPHTLTVQARLSSEELYWRQFTATAYEEANCRVIVAYKDGATSGAENLGVYLEYLNARETAVDLDFSAEVIYGGKNILSKNVSLNGLKPQRILICSYKDIESKIKSINDIVFKFDLSVRSPYRYLYLDTSHLTKFVKANFEIGVETYINGTKGDILEEGI